MALLTEIVQILVSGFSQFATGIGTGLNDYIKAIMLGGGENGQSLGTFGTIIIVFAGLALTIGLSRWVLNVVTSLGKRNR